jgi:hypothetical protein
MRARIIMSAALMVMFAASRDWVQKTGRTKIFSFAR